LYLELKEELEAKKIKESLDTTLPIIVEETIIEEIKVEEPATPVPLKKFV
jgi:hypothetical protein